MQILIVYSDLRCSCTKKCTFELSKGLKFFTNTDVLHHIDLNEHHFKKYDVILFQRLGGNSVNISESFYTFLENNIKKYKNKTYTAYFLDDLILNKGTERMMKMVNILLVPNPNYLKYVTPFNKNIFYTRTFLDLEEIEDIKNKNISKNYLKLLWASTGGVGSSFMEEFLPVLQDKIPNALVYILGGNSNRFIKFSNTSIYPILSYIEFIQYFKYCDIYLNPISIDTDYFRNVRTIDFINCKSELKYIISGAVKIPIISSKSQPYEYAIKNGINGILLDNNCDLWIESIDNLTKNIKFKNKLIKNAYEDVVKNYTIKSIGEKVYNLFKSFFENKTGKSIDVSNYTGNTNTIDINQFESNSIVGEIFGNKKIYQSFTSKQNGLFRIDLKFATYIRENKGTLRFSLCESFEGSPIRYKDIDCSSIYDNLWHTVVFDTLWDSAGKLYFIRIEGINCRIGSSVTIYYSTSTKSIGDLFINKTKFNGALTFKSYNVNE